ncbi:unnamed protein product [Rotaria socialis]|uniref:Uncharacterized protein n=1 Tax=Rotaria socialis TaxID=392032 RepID=A0A817YNN1_9BILA|nr:unnamed protein product [Rotaria socialis]
MKTSQYHSQPMIHVSIADKRRTSGMNFDTKAPINKHSCIIIRKSAVPSTDRSSKSVTNDHTDSNGIDKKRNRRQRRRKSIHPEISPNISIELSNNHDASINETAESKISTPNTNKVLLYSVYNFLF